MTASDPGVDPVRVAEVLRRERDRWTAARPRAAELHRRAQHSLLHGAPLVWLHHFPPPAPPVIRGADGARLYDIDGHEYADFGLAATASLWGHTHPAVVAALNSAPARGISTMWPTEDHAAVAELLAARFRLPTWQFTVSATDANRAALRVARSMTGRPTVLVFDRAYHGALEETYVTLGPDGAPRPTPAAADSPFDPTTVCRVAAFNDVPAVERQLAHGDVAAVLTEPVMTNGGTLIHPEPGFHQQLRALTRRSGTLLIVDETQTIPAGPSGCTGELGLEPDILAMGKWPAAGIPAGVYGMSEEVASAAARMTESGDGGLASTLAANALTTRVMRAVLQEVMTEQTYTAMTGRAERYRQHVAQAIRTLHLPWHVGRLGARVSYAFSPTPPSSPGPAASATERSVRHALWLYLANRGCLVNPMSGAVLVSAQSDDEDVRRLGELTAGAFDVLAGGTV